MREDPQKAFTLIEIMVALAIITIALGAIIENTTASNQNAQYLRDKSVATWVAINQITLKRAKREWGGASNKQGEVEMAGLEWNWKMSVKNTDDPNMRRLEIEVFKEDQNDPLVSMTGFVGRL